MVSKFLSRAFGTSFSLGCLALLGLIAFPAPLLAETFPVTNNDDSGVGSLRQAILNANANGSGEVDYIPMQIGGGPVLVVGAALPVITTPVFIDGYAQANTVPNSSTVGSNAVLFVELDGVDRSFDGLVLSTGASGSWIRGLVIRGFRFGIDVAGASNVVISGNFIGCDRTGTLARPNTFGIRVRPDGANEPNAVRIGGTFLVDRNLVSGNLTQGIQTNQQTPGLTIVGNNVGTTASGLATLTNSTGISIFTAAQAGDPVVIGAAGHGRNVVAAGFGGSIDVVQSSTIRITHNLIGVSTTGTPLPSGGTGIFLQRIYDAVVERNVVANHNGPGVSLVLASERNRIVENSIYANGGLGIDLSPVGITTNDDGDADGGSAPNLHQNHPVPGSGGLQPFVLRSTPSSTFRVDFYANTACDPSGNGEGEQHLGVVSVTTDAQGVADVPFTFEIAGGRQLVTATATDAVGNTSEFSPCVATSAVSGTITGGTGAPLAGVTVAITGSARPAVVTGPDGTYRFTGLPRGSTYGLNASLPGFAFTTGAALGLPLTTDVVVDAVGYLLVDVSGEVVDLNGSPVAGVSVALNGVQQIATTTDAEGRYAFAHVFDGAYTLTPSRSGFGFEPALRTLPLLSGVTTPAETRFVAASGAFTRYFAEGATGAFFDTDFAVLNPTATTAAVTFDFQRSGGSTVTLARTVPPHTRASIDAASVAGLENAEFSTVVRSDVPVISDRTMHWGAGGYGSHAETSLAAPAETWYLAEGATISGFNLFYLLQNPATTIAEVRVTYLRPAPAPPLVRTYFVDPQSRFTIWANVEDPALAAAEVSAVLEVTNGVPIIVERAMYRDTPGLTFSAGHASAGVTAPATRWFLAEGNTGPFFDLFVLVANPGLADAPITVSYLLPSGETLEKSYVVPANSRFNIWVDEEELPAGSGQRPLANTAVSTTVTSTPDAPVIVERSMWWPGDSSTWLEGHNTPGTTRSGTVWAVADGETGGVADAQTYLLIANTSLTPGSARVTLFFENGSTVQRTFPLAPTSRFNVAIAAEFPDSTGRRFGALVESLGESPAQLVVERAMYGNAGGVPLAAGTVVLATRLQ